MRNSPIGRRLMLAAPPLPRLPVHSAQVSAMAFHSSSAMRSCAYPTVFTAARRQVSDAVANEACAPKLAAERPGRMFVDRNVCQSRIVVKTGS